MNITDINRTIQELENDSTTFENCYKLSSLYIIRDNYKSETEKELDDILPQYSKYVDIKRRYQLGELSENVVEKQVKIVCKEIYEFIHSLYSATDSPNERICIKNMINTLQELP